MIYDKLASRYDKFFAPFEKRFLGRWREETLSQLPKNSRILEIGAGTGANFQFYPTKSKCAVASEISFDMLEFAKTKVENRNIAAVQADAEILPFPDDYFDAVFATLVFCSIPKPENAFDEIKRILKPDGKLILLEHIRPKGLLGCVFDLLNVLTVALLDDHFNRRTAKIAEKSGFKILNLQEKAFGIVQLMVCKAEQK